MVKLDTIECLYKGITLMAFSSSPARPASTDPLPGMVQTGALADAADALEKLMDLPMTAVIAMKIIKIRRWLAPLLAGYQSERNEIVQRYGVVAGEGKFTIAPENVPPYTAALNGLRAEQTAAPPADILMRISEMADTMITPSTVQKIELFIRD